MILLAQGHVALKCDVLNVGKRSPNDFLRCPHYSPHTLPLRGTAASTPHRDAAGQNALYGASVECSEGGWGQVGSPHPDQEVQMLLNSLYQ